MAKEEKLAVCEAEHKSTIAKVHAGRHSHSVDVDAFRLSGPMCNIIDLHAGFIPCFDARHPTGRGRGKKRRIRLAGTLGFSVRL